MTPPTPITTTPLNANLPQITSNSFSQHHVRSNDSRNLNSPLEQECHEFESFQDYRRFTWSLTSELIELVEMYAS